MSGPGWQVTVQERAARLRTSQIFAQPVRWCEAVHLQKQLGGLSLGERGGASASKVAENGKTPASMKTRAKPQKAFARSRIARNERNSITGMVEEAGK